MNIPHSKCFRLMLIDHIFNILRVSVMIVIDRGSDRGSDRGRPDDRRLDDRGRGDDRGRFDDRRSGGLIPTSDRASSKRFVDISVCLMHCSFH